MAEIVIKDKMGKDVTITIPDNVDPRSLGVLTKTIQELKPKRGKDSPEYGMITKVTGSDDRKTITFHTEKDSFSYSFVTNNFIHDKTGLPFLASHKITMSGMIKGTDETRNPTWEKLCNMVEGDNVDWLRAFFTLMQAWANGGQGYRQGPACRSCNNMNMLADKEAGVHHVQKIESWAKNEYCINQILHNMHDFKPVVFKGTEVKSFNMVYKGSNGIDGWLLEHGGESVNTNYISMHYHKSWNHGNISLEGAVESPKLSKYTKDYLDAQEAGYADLFRMAWEKYKIPIDSESVGKKLTNLVEEHKYDKGRLLEYVLEDMPRQGFLLCRNNFDSEYITPLVDYVEMCSNMKLNDYEKYPKSIKMAHDIAQMHYMVAKIRIETKKFEKASAAAKKLEFEHGQYKIVAPTTPMDISNEGTKLNHCVASYIPRIVKGETLIMFMRDKHDETKPLITVEVRDRRVHQAKGAYNKHPDKTQREFLDKYEKFLSAIEG